MTSEGFGASTRRSRAILRAAWTTLRRHPRLAWFPVLSGIGMVVLGGVIALLATIGGSLAAHPVAELGPVWGAIAEPSPDRDVVLHRALSVGGLVAYLGGHLLMVAIGVAMSHASLEAMAGRPWTVRSALARASERRSAIVTFAFVDATVGRLLRGRGDRERKGRKGRKRGPGLLSRLARFAWWAATYLVLPVLARESRGGIGSIERSASLLRQTWRETLVARFAIGWLWIPAVLVAAIPIALCAAFGVRDPAVLVVAIGVPALGLLAFGLVLRTLDVIYRAALYTYATEGVVPESFDTAALVEVWHVAAADEVPDGDPSVP